MVGDPIARLIKGFTIIKTVFAQVKKVTAESWYLSPDALCDEKVLLTRELFSGQVKA